MFILIFY